MNKLHSHLWLLVIASFLFLGGCATVPAGSRDARDPWESMNRSIFSFNKKLDKNVMRPVAVGYTKVVPSPIRAGIFNFFSNLRDIYSVPHSFLQGKLRQGFDNFARVLINTTIGIGGLFDVATALNVPRKVEDFGSTFATWGIPSGPYLVLPILGPSSVRDGVGTVGDIWYAPTSNVYGYYKNDEQQFLVNGLQLIDTRAQYLGADKLIESSTLDEYVTFRDGYLQRREALSGKASSNKPKDPLLEFGN